MCVNACGMCPLSQGRVSMKMMCVLISLLHQISTILSVNKNVDVLSCVAILVYLQDFKDARYHEHKIPPQSDLSAS